MHLMFWKLKNFLVFQYSSSNVVVHVVATESEIMCFRVTFSRSLHITSGVMWKYSFACRIVSQLLLFLITCNLLLSKISLSHVNSVWHCYLYCRVINSSTSTATASLVPLFVSRWQFSNTFIGSLSSCHTNTYQTLFDNILKLVLMRPEGECEWVTTNTLVGLPRGKG